MNMSVPTTAAVIRSGHGEDIDRLRHRCRGIAGFGRILEQRVEEEPFLDPARRAAVRPADVLDDLARQSGRG
jgi:hypothetical protein